MKRVRLLLVIVILSVVLGACGTTPEPQASTQAIEVEKEVEQVAVPDCAIEPPAKPVEFTYLGWPMPVMAPYTTALDKCNAVKNIKVYVREMDNASAIEQMSLAFGSGGASPFAIVMQSNSSIQQNVWKGWLMPLDDLVEKYWEKYQLDDIAPVHWEAATFDGTIYGIPMTANVIMLMYRSDLFKKYNLKVPTTYDEIISACGVLKQEPGLTVPFAMDLSAGWAWSIAFYEALASLGGNVFVEGTFEPAFNSPEGVAALTKIKEVADACMGVEGMALGSNGMGAGMGNGTIGFIHTWASEGAALIDPEKSDMWDKIAFAPAASVEAGGKLAGSSWNDFWAIPASFEGDADLVFQLIMEAARADHQAEAAKAGLVPRTSALLSSENPLATAALETLEKGVGPVPKSIAYPILDAALGNYLPFVGSGELTPKEALQKAEEQYISEATDKGYLK
ncbi:MAG: extracellular solute-binding protein [Candidatus Methanosuratus sp.]|nr:extracellular solute-binding protein [Candidatus Methanosuratincola sp.]